MARFSRTYWRLNVLGYDVGPADGVAGPGTQQAVRRFLQQRKLDPNAKIDEVLLNALVAAIVDNPPIPEGRVSLHSAKVDLQGEKQKFHATSLPPAHIRVLTGIKSACAPDIEATIMDKIKGDGWAN